MREIEAPPQQIAGNLRLSGNMFIVYSLALLNAALRPFSEGFNGAS
jgi:hypothetical protein